MLYKKQLVTDAYIIGSVARGLVSKDSDIDLVLVNPKFEGNLLYLDSDYDKGEIGKLINNLKDIGIEFKLLQRARKPHEGKRWYQIYKTELFHIAAVSTSIDIKKHIDLKNEEHIQIKKDLC